MCACAIDLQSHGPRSDMPVSTTCVYENKSNVRKSDSFDYRAGEVFRNASRSPISESCSVGHGWPSVRVRAYMRAPCRHKSVARRTAV